MTPLLQLTSVTKSFGAVRALKGVSFDLRSGEVHALLGENGAGKSTLIKIITGAHQPDSGTIHINGEHVMHLTPASAHKLGIACIYQQPALFPDLTVAENIALRLEPATALRKVNWPARCARAEKLLQRIGANISLDAEVRSLSMPEQQLVEIACVLGTGARIVIMDEPTASLTQKEVELLFAIVRELRSNAVGIIYITHRLEEIFALADRVTVLRDGESVDTRFVRTPPSPHPGPIPKGEGETHRVSRPIERATFADTPPTIPPPYEPEGRATLSSARRGEALPISRRLSDSRRGEDTVALPKRTGSGAQGANDRSGKSLPKGEGRGEGEQEQQRPLSFNSTSTALTESELIRMMVGREVSHIYPPAEGEPREVILSLRNLGCSASGVKNITLDVRAGEIVGLAGLVGAGRTELARTLFGLTPADSGEILLDGQLITVTSPQQAVERGIAYVPEDRRRHGVILDMPIAHNMTMAIHRRLFPGAWLRFSRERALSQNLIGDLDVRTTGPDAPGHSLSGGNQQKVSLARWLATNPKVLILDEPTQGVDVGAKSEIHKIIRRLAKEGMAVLMISSDLPEILGMSDRIAVMRGGAIAAMLPGKCDAPDVMAAALGQSPELNRGGAEARR